MNRGFWQGRRVLLTGHTGFKGAWLSLWLQDAGAELMGLALEPPSDPSLFVLADVASGMNHRHGDVRDHDQVKDVFRHFQPEVVFHLAAQSLVRDSYERPVDTFATNVMGTVHVLEAIRCTPTVKAAVVVTSDKCYENREWVWGYREQDPMGGHDPYSASKGCAELVVASYRRSFCSGGSVAVASARAGNVIGGGDWARDRLLPDAVRAFAHGQPLVVRNPSAVRPWQHVLEPLQGYLLLAERLHAEGRRYEGAWNFGPKDTDARPVEEIIGTVSKLWGDGARWEREGNVQPHEAMSLRLDCSKARIQLGWRPQLELDVALEWVVAWFRQWQDGANVRSLTMRDISRYEALRS